MNIFDRVRRIFGKKDSHYEAALRKRADAIREALPEDASTLDRLKAILALVSDAEEDTVEAESRLLEDLELGDMEIMEIEILSEDVFGVDLSTAELNLADTLGDLADLIDGKREKAGA